MNCTGNQFFAGTAFPNDQNARGADILQTPHILENRGDGRALTDETRNTPAPGFLRGEVLELFVRPLAGVDGGLAFHPQRVVGERSLLPIHGFVAVATG